MKSSKKKSVRIPAFAKINLCLHVMGKRPDGYHELRTIFQTISLADSLELTRVSEPGITLETNDAELPTGPGNLVYRAIDAIACETGFRGGVRASLEKRIPVARGLGVGARDDAAGRNGIRRPNERKVALG